MIDIMSTFPAQCQWRERALEPNRKWWNGRTNQMLTFNIPLLKFSVKKWMKARLSECKWRWKNGRIRGDEGGGGSVGWRCWVPWKSNRIYYRSGISQPFLQKTDEMTNKFDHFTFVFLLKILSHTTVAVWHPCFFSREEEGHRPIRTSCVNTRYLFIIRTSKFWPILIVLKFLHNLSLDCS